MRHTFFALCLATCSSASILQNRGCNADNCARAVTGTRYEPVVQASRKADCSSFLMETITPATPTTTVTVTSTSYSVIGSNAKRTAAAQANIQARDVDDFLSPPATPVAAVKVRQVTQVPSQVPTYASACSGTARYSSACSCAGVTVSTTYAPTPATSTITETSTSVVPVCDPAQNYGYNYLGGNIEPGVVLVRTSNGLSPQACCASCYVLGSACFVYQYFNNACLIVTETGGSHTPTDYCPYGQYRITNQGGGSFYGFGPCATF